MDIHPSGFYMLLGFNSHLRFVNIMSGHLKEYHRDTDIKSPLDVKFSNGGHFFAVTDASDVVVFKFFNAMPIYRF